MLCWLVHATAPHSAVKLSPPSAHDAAVFASRARLFQGLPGNNNLLTIQILRIRVVLFKNKKSAKETEYQRVSFSEKKNRKTTEAKKSAFLSVLRFVLERKTEFFCARKIWLWGNVCHGIFVRLLERQKDHVSGFFTNRAKRPGDGQKTILTWKRVRHNVHLQ